MNNTSISPHKYSTYIPVTGKKNPQLSSSAKDLFSPAASSSFQLKSWEKNILVFLLLYLVSSTKAASNSNKELKPNEFTTWLDNQQNWDTRGITQVTDGSLVDKISFHSNRWQSKLWPDKPTEGELSQYWISQFGLNVGTLAEALSESSLDGILKAKISLSIGAGQESAQSACYNHDKKQILVQQALTYATILGAVKYYSRHNLALEFQAMILGKYTYSTGDQIIKDNLPSYYEAIDNFFGSGIKDWPFKVQADSQSSEH